MEQMTATVATHEKIISIEHFTMQFGDTVVVDDVSFDVKQGETFGLLGSNGSGKTTTLRCLLGIHPATRGTLHIGSSPFHVGGRIKIGYLPEERGLYKKESVLATMVYFGRLKGLTSHTARDWSMQFLERVGLADKAAVRLDKLSGGQQQKVQLGVTIMDRPELLILDEPTKGFDPVNRRLLMDIIEEHQQAGATVVYVSHDMAEVERLCDRVIMLGDGQVKEYGSVADVRKRHDSKSLDDIFVELYGRATEADNA